MAVLNPERQITDRARSLSVGVIALAAAIALLYFGKDFFITLIVSAGFAFILDPLVILVMKLRIPRAASAAIVIIVALVAVYLLAVVIWTQLLTLSEDLPTYSSRIVELLDKANEKLDNIEKKTIDLVVPNSVREQEQQIQQKPIEAAKARKKRQNPPQPVIPAEPQIQEVRIHQEQRPLIATVFSYAANYFHLVVMASFVPFLVYFMLSWRDHISHTFQSLFRGEAHYMVERSWSGIGESTRGYVLGNFLLWVFVGSASAVAFFLLGVPYWPLVGPVSAFFSLVPYVGLPLSILPPALAALAVPNKFKVVVLVVVITTLLHLIAMNFLYAKVIGRRVRLNPFIVTVALMFWGMLWGAPGLLLAVPLTASIKAVCDNVESLQDYGKLLGD